MSATATPWPRQSFLARLAPRDRDELLTLGIRYLKDAGNLVVAQGEQSYHVVVLETGFVKVTATTAGEQEALMAVRGPGDIIGELAAMSGAERSATVTTCGRVTGRLIPQATFRCFLNDHSKVLIHLAAMVGDKLVWANRRRTDFVSLPAGIRVARVLRDLATVFAEPSASHEPVNVRVTQPELASIAGIREVTVQKELRGLRDRGVIATGYRKVLVIRPDLLRDLCAQEVEEWEMVNHFPGQEFVIP